VCGFVDVSDAGGNRHMGTGIWAQGLNVPPGVSKDDWEEINFEFNSSVLVDGFPSLLRLAEPAPKESRL